MKIQVSLLATALLLGGCQRLPFSFSPLNGATTPTPAPTSTSSGGPDILTGQSIFHSGNGNNTPGCDTCHPGMMLAGMQVSDITYCLGHQAPMIQNFGPNGLSPLSQAEIADIAAYIASSKFPN